MKQTRQRLRGYLFAILFVLLAVLDLHAGNLDRPFQPDVTVYTNIAYAGDGSERRWLADVAVPTGEQIRPMVIFVHGGGWSKGRKDYVRWNSGMKWAGKNGFVYARINYRLAQHAPFPAALHDVMNAVRFFRLNAGAFGVDPDKIVLAGASAGAHLATLAAFAANEDTFETGTLYPGVSARVAAVAGLGGVYDLAGILDQHRGLVTAFMGGDEAMGPESLAGASPASYLDEEDPPLLLIHSKRDAIAPVRGARNLASAAREAGVRTKLLEIDSDQHEVPDHPSHWEQVVWFRESLGGTGTE